MRESTEKTYGCSRWQYWPTSVRKLVLLVAFTPVFFACGAVVPAAINLGKNLLVASTNNYSPAYASVVDEMLGLLSKTGESGNAVPDTGKSSPLKLNVALLKDGSPPVPVENGTVLYDGRNNLQESDRIKITFGANQLCYVYVVSIDATGWVTPVFPSSESSFQNPVLPDQSIQIPENTRWYALDTYRGVETFYFLASRVRRPDLENLLSELGSRKRSPIKQYQPVESATIATRGIVAIETGSPTQVQNQAGQTHNVTPTSFLAQVGSVDLVVTRWFQHK